MADSVRVRVTLLATFLTAVVLVVGALLLTRAVERRLVSDREHVAQSAVGFAVQQVEAGVPFTDIEQQPLDQGAGVGIFDVATGAPVGGLAGPVKTIQFIPPGSAPSTGIVLISGPDPQDVTYHTQAVSVGGDRFFVVGVASLAEVRRSMRTLWSGLRFGIPAVVIAVALVAWFLAGRALRPVERMRRAVDTISGSTLERRVHEPSSHDEVARLARTMNSMLSRLQASRDHERQFLSDASHELRSPLASMRAQLETGDWPDHASGVRAEAERLAHIVDDLVDLAKADETAPAATETDLDEVVLEEVAAVGRGLAVPVHTTGVGAARLSGDRPALARMVRNMIENAGRHARSRVDVSLSTDDGTITLTVDDDGDGVPPADRERIFERFTRTDASRSRDTGGVGLGLAVVRATARRHGGEVHCAESPAGGARFVVTLPEPAVAATETGR